MDSNEKNLIKKSNYLVESPSKLSLTEQKSVYMILREIRHCGNQKMYSFKIKEFMEKLDLKGQSAFSELKARTRQLRNRGMTIRYEPWIIEEFIAECKERNDLDESEINILKKLLNKNEVQVGWVSEVIYQDKEGIISFTLPTSIKPFLFNLSKYYTEFDIDQLMQMKRKHSPTLYELLKQYQGYAKNDIWWRTFSVIELREFLGIAKDEYPRFSNFKQKVLNPCIEEINDKTTDIQIINVLEDKIVNRVENIKFIMTVKKESTLEELIDQFKKTTGGGILIPERLQELIDLKGVEKVKNYIKNFNKFNNAGIQDVSALFYWAVKTEQPFPKKGKLPQETNYVQRTYDEDFLKSLYYNN